ncbi:hypothetical protein ACEC18_004403 [Vibrio parahaemolyticus]
MNDIGPYHYVSPALECVILNEVIEPKSLEISKHRISQLKFEGDKDLYTMTLSTSDGFHANATFNLQQVQNPQLKFNQNFKFEVQEILISWQRIDDEEVSITTTECGEDFITSQFDKEQFVAVFSLGFTLVLSNLKKLNSNVMRARSSWYGDDHLSAPNGYTFFYNPD